MKDAVTPLNALDVSAVADAVASAVKAPPPPLPSGWILKASRSQPGYYYYYHSETGICSWVPPMIERSLLDMVNTVTSVSDGASRNRKTIDEKSPASLASVPGTELSDEIATSSDQNTNSPEGNSERDTSSTSEEKPSKRRKTSSSSGTPSQVRVLHILKKHKDSRRPSSWRQANITRTLEEAREELQGLLEILQEEESPEELRATFEELARTESDCSSAKRGGDLGFFGRRKMQPAFEAAAFGLQTGELTKELVETSSGAHVLLRIG